MLKTKDKQIGSRGYIYTVRQLGAKQGQRVLIRLMKTIGKPIGDAIAAGQSDNAIAGKIIAGLSEVISEEDVDFLCDVFVKNTEVQGGNEDAWRNYPQQIALSAENNALFDFHFAGAYSEMMQWLLFCVEVNYSDFLPDMGGVSLSDALRGLVRKAAKQSGSQSQNISEQTGTSGE